MGGGTLIIAQLTWEAVIRGLGEEQRDSLDNGLANVLDSVHAGPDLARVLVDIEEVRGVAER